MASLQIRDMREADEVFVASCTHVGESDEWDACARRRVAWLRDMHGRGLRVKVAIVDGKQAGFLYLLPIEISPSGPVGRDLSVIQCLTVKDWAQGRGAGRGLVSAAEEEARGEGRKGIVVVAYYHDFWFMPATFFESCGFSSVKREGTQAILWKVFDVVAQPPAFMESRYRFEPVEGKVAVDLFWSRSCLTTDTEAERVREVAAEFGDAIEVREFCADDLAIRSRYQLPRGIFVNGREIGWGYEAPKEGIRQAIREAMEGIGQPKV